MLVLTEGLPPFAAWKAHNDPLPNDDHFRVMRLISDAESYLVRLDGNNGAGTSQDKHDTRNPLCRVLTTREQVLGCLDSLRKAIAPHRQLPNEILTAIFAFCLPDPITLPLRSSVHCTNWALPQLSLWESTPPWNLLAVCHRWRQVVLNTPMLWSTLTLHLKKVDEFTRHAGMFDQLLRYSGTSTPLQLRIMVDDCYSRTETQGVGRLLEDLLVPHARRLWRLSLSLPISVLEPFLTMPTNPAFDLLETVNIEYNGRPVTLNTVPRHVFKEAPRLRQFVMTAAKLPMSSLNLPWEQLRELHLCGTTATAEDCYRVLQHSPFLVNCSISLRDDLSLSKGQNVVPMRFSRLASFTLESDVVLFLEALELPLLESLTLKCDVDQASCEATLLPFLARSPRLTKLVLNWWIPSETLKIILNAMPLLTHLQFVPGKTGEVVKLLWTINLLPNLKSLVFLCYPAMWEEVVEIIGLRGMVGQLRDVHITTFFRKEVDSWEKDPRLRTLREIGMSLRLSHIVQGRYS
ncbi:hypothetical protein H0H87_002375 [Tephrocybe sp. NHM501043]|nr:hypothetical protein H0H87_002375 [Tephrocybe sp. NHM501043]